MPPYTAQRPSLYGVGSPGYINTAPDIGQAIDAIAGSASSLVQQAYMRKMQQREQVLREQEFELQQQREARESAAQQRQLDISERTARAREAASGYVAPHDEMSMETPTPSLTTRPTSRVATAMISGLPSQEGNSRLTRPVDLGTEGQPRLVTRHVDESYDPTQSAAYVRSVGVAGARHQARMDEIDEAASQRQPKWITKVDDKGNYFRLNPATGDVDPLLHPDGTPIKAPARSQGRASTAESTEITASRKDLMDTGRQQVRAENAVKALKSEQRQLQKDNPRVAKPMGAQRTSADSAAAQQFQNLGTQITEAQGRSKALTSRADSISRVIDRRRAGSAAPSSGSAARAAAEAGAAIDPDSITDEELVAAHAAGARTNDAVKAFVATARQRTPKKKKS